jgi:hypothetical protein
MTIVHQIKETLEQISPFDKEEQEHLLFTKKWMDSGAGIFRIAKSHITSRVR